jgi:hypothetical protein
MGPISLRNVFIFLSGKVEGKRSLDFARVDSVVLREVASTRTSTAGHFENFIDFAADAAQNCISYAAEWGDSQPSPTDCGLESFMKPIHEMLKEKQLELARLQKEVEALRLVAGMISEESKAATTDSVSLPAVHEISPPRPAATPVANPITAAPPPSLSVPPAPLNPPPMMMRPPAPAFGEGALASANDALAKRFP